MPARADIDITAVQAVVSQQRRTELLADEPTTLIDYYNDYDGYFANDSSLSTMVQPRPFPVKPQPNVTCYYTFPNVKQYFAMISKAQLIALIVCAVIGAVIFAQFLLHWYTITKNVRLDYKRSLLLRLAALYPVIAACSLMGIFVPATSGLMRIITPLLVDWLTGMLTVTLVTILSLVRLLFGGNGALMSAFLLAKDVRINLAARPCCCFKCCCPKLKATRGNLRWLQFVVYQASILTTVLAFAVFVAFSNGENLAKFSGVVSALKLASTIFAMYGCLIFVELTQKALHADYRMFDIFQQVQLMMFVISIQSAIFDVLGAHGIIPPANGLSGMAMAYIYNHMVQIAEALFLQCIVTWRFRPTNCALFDSYPLPPERRQQMMNEQFDAYYRAKYLEPRADKERQQLAALQPPMQQQQQQPQQQPQQQQYVGRPQMIVSGKHEQVVSQQYTTTV